MCAQREQCLTQASADEPGDNQGMPWVCWFMKNHSATFLPPQGEFKWQGSNDKILHQSWTKEQTEKAAQKPRHAVGKVFESLAERTYLEAASQYYIILKNKL